MKTDGARAVLLAADAFVALTAAGGGIALAAGLEGDRFPPELLAGTPFGSYVVPGLILAGTVGSSSAIATAAMLRRPGAGARASVLAGAVLMGWIVGEVLVLRAPAARSWVEALYFAVGLLMAGLGLEAGLRRQR